MVEVGATAHTRRGKGGLQTLVTGTMTSVSGPGTVDHNAMGRPGTSGTIATTVEVEVEDMTTGDVGTTNKDSTNLKVNTNNKVGTNLRAKGKDITHLQVNIRIKVKTRIKDSTNKVHNRDRHHRTRNKTKEVGIKDKATIRVKVAIPTSREWKLEQRRRSRGVIPVVPQGATQISTYQTHRHLDLKVVEYVV